MEIRKITINDIEIPAFINTLSDITLVGLKDDQGNVKLFVYNNGEYTFNFKGIHNLTIQVRDVVIVDNSIYEVNNDTITSNNIIYNKVHAYSVINGNEFDEFD